MKVKAANGLARILKAEGIPWVSCYPTNHVNNALGEEGVPIYMMGEERFAVAVADAFSRVTCGKRIGVCTIMANLNAAGIQMAYGAIAQAWEDSSPLLLITEGVSQGAVRHTQFDMAEALRSVTKWVRKIDRADLVPDYVRRAFTQLRSARPGPVLLILPRDLGEYDEDERPYAPVKGWRSGPDPWGFTGRMWPSRRRSSRPSSGPSPRTPGAALPSWSASAPTTRSTAAGSGPRDASQQPDPHAEPLLTPTHILGNLACQRVPNTRTTEVQRCNPTTAAGERHCSGAWPSRSHSPCCPWGLGRPRRS